MKNEEHKFEIESTEQNELKELYISDIEEEPTGKILHIKKDQNNTVFNSILAQLSQYIDIKHTLTYIEKGTQYVVQVPLKYQKGLEEGKYFINQNKNTGVMWPTLVEIQENGQRQFVDDLPIVEQKLNKGNPEHEILTNFYNIALQNQILSLSDTVEKTYKKVERIEHGQMDDRIALVNSGIEQIQGALLLKNTDDRRAMISSGRNSIYEGKNKIGCVLKRMIEEFEPIPSSWFIQLKDEILHKGILNERDNDFREIQKYYEVYIKVTKLLAYSFILTQDIEAAKLVYQKSINYIKSINFEKVKTIEYIHKVNDTQDLFVFHPVEYIEEEQKNMDKSVIDADYMFIEATGEELLEALGYGKEVREQDIE